jgi:sugar O-acyltransferase (sialic acid O-acetyltransferase NeuD family)
MAHPDKHRMPLVVVGGGGHALVVAEAAALAGCEIVGFLDDDPDAALGRGRGSALRIGPLKDLPRIADRFWILGIGNLEFRNTLLQTLAQLELGRGAKTVLHPDATVSPTAMIGPGVYVGPRAVVHSRAAVHEHAIVNSGAIVEHECVIAENAHIAPGAVVGGGVKVGSGSLVGIGARVLPGLSIGENCVIGAGAVVIRSVLDGGKAVGVPARSETEKQKTR